MHHVQILVRHTMESPYGIGILSMLLVFVPIIGMHLVHKYGWEHWEPFSKHEPHTETIGGPEQSDMERNN